MEFKKIIYEIEHVNKKNDNLKKDLRSWIETLSLPDEIMNSELCNIIDYLHGNIIRVNRVLYKNETPIISKEEYSEICDFIKK